MSILICFVVTLLALQQTPFLAAHRFGDVLESEERNQIMSMLDETKEMAGQVEAMLLKVLPEIPTGKTYEELHNNVLEYYDKVHGYKERKYHCRKRARQFLEGFKEFSEIYSNEQADTPEKQEVVRLLEEAGLKEMREKFNEKMARDEFDYILE
ncbi:uncharacterized protein LOC101889346 [Musca domestica]|uniref:Uncharacterized protein LOC101889346 n=1 Tax=Musca domestica TaxID=7370 RepID=A0A1I8MDZ7_MUSDO|nr:uncharacterized protein LOC101889346 [Musca domestica]